jgi:aspartate-semialdehyde dehydrogenase
VFELTEVAASEKSSGHKYGERINWMMNSPLPESVASMTLKNCKPDLDCKVVFSGLDSSVAGEIETEFADHGYHVISNSKNHRWDADVPLLVPEINHDHLKLIDTQPYKGSIVTNPNCSTIGMALALKPLIDNFGVELVNVVTMQAISGAGFPGVPSMSITDNVIPYISGEEEKMEAEPLKIFSALNGGKLKMPDIKISAQCNRVHVIDGHLEVIQVTLKNKVPPSDIIEAWRNFSSLPQSLQLPSAPVHPLYYSANPSMPQPRLSRDIDKGMAVSIGRLRECSLFDYKFAILSHNTVRGAAGGSILCAELMLDQGYLN